MINLKIGERVEWNRFQHITGNLWTGTTVHCVVAHLKAGEALVARDSGEMDWVPTCDLQTRELRRARSSKAATAGLVYRAPSATQNKPLSLAALIARESDTKHRNGNSIPQSRVRRHERTLADGGHLLGRSSGKGTNQAPKRASGKGDKGTK